MINENTRLILSGVETAMSELLWSRQPGDLHITLDARATPACIIKTREGRIIRVEDADAQLAFEYGEWDRTLPSLREHPWVYDVQECHEHGWDGSPTMLLTRERFRIMFPGADS